MSLRFILGRAGSGKTWACLDQIRREAARSPRGPNLIMLVPEQASHQTERALWCAPGGPHASLRAAVLSFRRLAARVLAETGATGVPVLDELGRRMLLTALAVEKEPELTVFRGASRRRGFAARLSRTVSECNAQGVRAADLWAQHRAATGDGTSDDDPPAGSDPTLGGKLHDLALLLGQYRERIAGSYIDPEEVLDFAADRVEGVSFLRGARLWVDGFAGFTPQQYALLGRILGVADELNVALCIDPGIVSGAARRQAALAGLFAPTAATHDRLVELARETKTTILPPVVLPAKGRPTRFRPGGVLAHLEARWETPEPFVRAAPGPAADAVRLSVAPDQRAEVTAAAEEIVRLCREDGYEWRDISVLVPDMDSYHDLLRTIFADHGIPCFLDRRRPVPYHPLVEFFRSAVEICQSDFAPEPVFRWLKTDLGPLGRDEVDLLENYVLEHGIRGRRWLDPSPWQYTAGNRDLGPLSGDSPGPGGAAGSEGAAPTGVPTGSGDAQELLGLINQARLRVVEALGPLYRELRAASRVPIPARDLVSSLVALASRAGVASALEGWRDGALAEGLPEQAQEHEEVWRQVVRLLEQAYAGLGGTPLRLDQFGAVLEAGLESLALGLVPPSLDQVVCGTVERSRQPDVRATFVLGACQGALPSIPAEDLVFNDGERDRLASRGLALAPTARERSFHLRYLTYVAITRASEYLWVSWPARQGERESPGPAAAVASLKLLFPELKEAHVGGYQPFSPPGPPVSLGLAAQRTARVLSLARQGQRLHRGWLDLYDWLAADPARRAAVRTAMAGLGWRNEAVPLDADLARSLFRFPVRGSASRLERFAGCPFAHYAGDGLRLVPRPRQQVRAPELGTFFHAVLQAFFNELIRTGVDLGDAPEEKVGNLLEGALDAITPRLQSEVLLSSGRYRYLARILGRTVRRTVWWLQRHARRSAFRTVAAEVGFGLPGSKFGALDLGGVCIRGVIDRIDLAEKAGRRLVRIIDYKSGASGWHLSDVVYDLRLQLLLYLAAALDMLPGLFGGPVEVAGVFLFPVRDPLLRLSSPEEIVQADDLRIEDLRPDGLVLDDAQVAQLMDTEAGLNGPGRLFPFRVTASGAVQGRQAVSAEQLEMLVRYAKARAGAIAGRIAAGDDALSPWRRGTRRACSFCDFHPVCAFDPSLPGNRYRELRPVSKEDIWQMIEAGSGGVAGE